MSQENRIESEEAKQVAETILQQLGGKRFAVMTGAKFFIALREQCGGLQFKLPSTPEYAKQGINTVKIILTASDVYDVQYGKVRGTTYSVLKESGGLYADMLQSDFTEATGLFTSL